MRQRDRSTGAKSSQLFAGRGVFFSPHPEALRPDGCRPPHGPTGSGGV